MARPKHERRRFPRTREVVLRVAPLALLLIIAAVLGYRLGWFDYRHAVEHVGRLRRTHSVAEFTVAFVVAIGVATSIGVPGLPLIVTAGALFGTLLGSVLSWCGVMLGAAIGYWIARKVGRDVVMRWLTRYKRIDGAVTDARHFGGILRLRLIPVLPLGTVNFVGGLARAHFAVYLAATAIGTVPSIIIYTYFADSLLERVGNGRTDALKSLILSSVLLLMLTLAPRWFARGKSDQAPVI
jgi:uncharacterized membrane protein YdjX (TVP38/TMEM64 family)